MEKSELNICTESHSHCYVSIFPFNLRNQKKVVGISKYSRQGYYNTEERTEKRELYHYAERVRVNLERMDGRDHKK